MLNNYSDYFQTLYDQTEPVGRLGRGTHYSVLRYASWFDVACNRLEKPITHDFAVIWDEDHDTRVITTIERIYEAGWLSAIQFIAERKATLYVMVTPPFRWTDRFDDFEKDLRKIAADVESDSWHLEIGVYDRSDAGQFYDAHQTEWPFQLIACKPIEQDIYLRSIDIMWDLGTWDFRRRKVMRGELAQLSLPEVVS